MSEVSSDALSDLESRRALMRKLRDDARERGPQMVVVAAAYARQCVTLAAAIVRARAHAMLARRSTG